MLSSEFLRERKALYDNLYHSRIILSEQSERAKFFADLLFEGAIIKDVPVLFTKSMKIKAIRLFGLTHICP